MAKGKKTGGRLPGSVNKTTAKAKDALEAAFDGLGGVPFLLTWAKENPTEFFKIWAKLVPRDIEVGTEEGGIVVRVVTGVPKGNAVS